MLYNCTAALSPQQVKEVWTEYAVVMTDPSGAGTGGSDGGVIVGGDDSRDTHTLARGFWLVRGPEPISEANLMQP